jgi:hypothetical protein
MTPEEYQKYQKLKKEVIDLKEQLQKEKEHNNDLYRKSFLAWVTGLTQKDIGRKWKEWLNTPRNESI